LLVAWLVALSIAHATAARADEPRGEAGTPDPMAPGERTLVHAPAQVDIKPASRDADIRERLERVLKATDSFIDARVRVNEGVVFLEGRAESDELKKWAGDLARSTQDVVAVANRMEVMEPSIWDLGPAWSGLFELWGDVVRSLPFFIFGLLVLMLSAAAGELATRVARNLLRRRVRAKLLRGVIARALGGLIVLLGVYVVLRVSGLTQLALTVVGGTGLLGLALGIAFRDITENLLASIFLSVQRPFETGDLVEVAGVTGYVQQLNLRTTILMTLEGNLVQIPNASVYKGNLRNFSTNRNRREDFIVGIGYADSINEAQAVARRILLDHPAVLDVPEPSVLVDGLGASTVDLRVYFWLDGHEHSWLKVRSSVIRLVKLAFQERGISMPDEAREVVFPQGLVVMSPEASESRERTVPLDPHEDPRVASTHAEAGLYSEAGVLEEQARRVQPLNEAENLLEAEADTPNSESPDGGVHLDRAAERHDQT
jgi:small conductance mechanosensitive channel